MINNNPWKDVKKLDQRDAINNFLCEIAQCFPAGLHNGFFNKLRTFLIRQAGAKIGNNSFIYRNTTIIRPSNIHIGDNTFINQNCLLSAYEKIEIGNNVMIGYNCKLITETHNYNTDYMLVVAKPIIIEDNVWIGSGSIILPGVKIGKNSVIGAGAVVTKEIQPYCLAAGNPARIIKQGIRK